ncbi:hypothetical protein [Flavobacterium polysaccharolyticum]|uniref:Uncharacterized protein n=1 Tax=Flavobacterium polysaccharolyticum TaxID=3133148 RepID=A0ABU9NQD5_9FLAO
MKKIQIALVLLFISTPSFSQTDFKFYKSVDDYTNDKFVPGYEIVENSFHTSFSQEKALK